MRHSLSPQMTAFVLAILSGCAVAEAWSPGYSHPHGFSSGFFTDYPGRACPTTTTTTVTVTASASSTSQAVTPSSLSATATIDAGVVVGTTTLLASATANVNKFLGIPFAQSPPERFTPPVSPKPFGAPLVAQAWKPACIQQFEGSLLVQTFTQDVFNTPAPEESEDCLYLNVYAPSTPPPPGGRAVMFWIYGGSLQFGNAGQFAYDGSAFAAYQDVIVVTTNYRTNVFGFPNTAELPLTERNLGFLDQRFALEWVQRNIHAFGGDPAKVTIFGESAGAFSIDALLTSYNSDTNPPPFRAAILESGQISYPGSPFAAQNMASWDALAAALNCTSSTSNLTCIRAANATTIKTIIDFGSLTFAPVVDNVTLVPSPAAARAAGQFAKVPVLGGTNAQEGRVFEFGSSNVTALLQEFFGSDVPEIIPAVAAAYPVGDIVGVNTGYDIVSQIFTDYIFQCPQALWANETAAQGVPTWRYYFDAEFPNTQNFPNAGIYHSSEIQIVWGTYSGGPILPLTPAPIGILATNVPATAQEYALSSFMNTAWAQFAKEPMHGPGWNNLGTFNESLGALGANGSGGVTVIDANTVDSKCSLYFPAYRFINGDLPGLS